MHVRITELTSRGLTRRRAQQAYSELAARDDGTDITIRLDDAELLSLSFLDELVAKLAEGGLLPRVTFAVDRPDYVNRLRRVRDARDVELFRNEGDQRRPVSPKSAPKLIEVQDPGDPGDEL